MQRLAGIFCALWTPTDAQGNILWDSLDRHLSFVLNSGVHGIMALGSTGEFPQLTLDQRRELMERIIAACQKHGNLPVIANVSDIQVRNVIALARHARSVGAHCISVLPPWFFPMEQRDLAEFFIHVGRESGAPLAIYNFQEVTGKKVAVETIRKIATTVEVMAVKQSGADFAYHHDLLQAGRDLGFRVLTGTDTRLEEALRLGCAGTVSGLANAVPEALCRIHANHGNGISSAAETELVNELARGMSPLIFPLNVKATIAARGFETGEPKFPVSAETAATYRRVVAELTRWFADKKEAFKPG